MKMDGRAAIVDIDDDERIVVFDTYKLKKITGTRVAPILGLSEHASPFKVACEMAGLYPGDKANKYIRQRDALEAREKMGNHPKEKNHLYRTTTPTRREIGPRGRTIWTSRSGPQVRAVPTIWGVHSPEKTTS